MTLPVMVARLMPVETILMQHGPASYGIYLADEELVLRGPRVTS